MSCRFICIMLITTAFCRTFANETATSEFVDKQSVGVLTAYKNTSNGNENEVHDKNLSKQSRTVNHRLESEPRDNCCGTRYDSSGSTRPDTSYNKIPGNGGRYPFKYGERLPDDRYAWQTHGQPPGWSASTGRPGSGSYIGGTSYEGSQTGDRFGSRPNFGSESSRRPGAYQPAGSGGYSYDNGGYGGYGFSRPTGYGGPSGNDGYGISGTFANGDEFGAPEPNYPEENAPSHPNIQTQKAVALKALAGVALLGAAAALATNPVLLPLGIISGRKKRSSLPIKNEDLYMDYILTALKANSTKIDNNEEGNKTSLSPTCIARLTCEIQKRYWSDFKKKDNLIKERRDLERRFTNLISNNAVNSGSIDSRVKMLIKAATTVASNGGHCNMFTCTFIKTKGVKNRVIFKV